MSIGKFAKSLILETSLSNTEILDKVKVQFPAAKTSMACIAWYKSDLRKKGLLASKRAPLETSEEKIIRLRAEIEALEALVIEAPMEEEITEE